MMPVNSIQYREVGIFNNHYFAKNSLKYSYFSKKYHSYDPFTLAIGLVIQTFWHLINVLSKWKFVSRFLPNHVIICNFSRKILYLSMIDVYVHNNWLCFIIIRLDGDIKENPGLKHNSDQSFFIFH